MMESPCAWNHDNVPTPLEYSYTKVHVFTIMKEPFVQEAEFIKHRRSH